MQLYERGISRGWKRWKKKKEKDNRKYSQNSIKTFLAGSKATSSKFFPTRTFTGFLSQSSGMSWLIRWGCGHKRTRPSVRTQTHQHHTPEHNHHNHIRLGLDLCRLLEAFLLPVLCNFSRHWQGTAKYQCHSINERKLEVNLALLIQREFPHHSCLALRF